MLPSEAVVLDRPILITPTVSHIEQVMNARYFVRMCPSLVRSCQFDTDEQMLLRDMLECEPNPAKIRHEDVAVQQQERVSYIGAGTAGATVREVKRR